MISRKKIKVGIGLSGGVDSSVAAALLVEKGYDVIGITMAVYDGPTVVKEAGTDACYGPGEEEDVEAVASICKKLGIPFFVIDLKNEYRKHVIDYFRSEYLVGRTPNPCIVCNQILKFGFLLKKAKETGVDFNFFATGHYAQITKSGKRFLLKKAADLSKDQTYFLYRLTPEQLSHTLFPLGKYTKHRVRKIARNLGFENAARSESQDFIAGGDYSILFNKEEAKEGNIIDKEGNVLGKHRGIIHYTIGQRRGLGIASHRPLYVAKIDAEKNKIIVDGRENLFSQGLIATDLNLIAIDRLDRPYNVKIKIRLQCRGVDAIVFPHENEKAKILFAEPQMSVAPGQSAVFYSDETVVGGGIIEQPL
ncbi:MAG: tRNA 2-thiouridine(34) synthase MnmA [Desulfobacterales bacterium]